MLKADKKCSFNYLKGIFTVTVCKFHVKSYNQCRLGPHVLCGAILALVLLFCF